MCKTSLFTSLLCDNHHINGLIFLLDFAKHAPASDIPKLTLLWDSIPKHLAKENKKFIFSFLCEFSGRIYPLEAGINPRSKSLQSYDVQFSPSILARATLLNLKMDGKILNLPLYALSLLPDLVARNDR